MPEEAKQHADSVVIGYAYKTFPQALIDWKNGQLKEFYREEPLVRPGEEEILEECKKEAIKMYPKG